MITVALRLAFGLGLAVVLELGSGGSRGRRLGQLPRAPMERGTKEGRAKIMRICMTKNVIDYIILNNQMFRINDIDIYNINQYSVALH